MCRDLCVHNAKDHLSLFLLSLFKSLSLFGEPVSCTRCRLLCVHNAKYHLSPSSVFVHDLPALYSCYILFFPTFITNCNVSILKDLFFWPYQSYKIAKIFFLLISWEGFFSSPPHLNYKRSCQLRAKIRQGTSLGNENKSSFGHTWILLDEGNTDTEQNIQKH